MPAYSEWPHLLCRPLTSMAELDLMSNMARSASYPSAILPFLRENASQGFSAPMRTASDRGISSRRTISMTMGIAVSTPGIPPGAESKSPDFSSWVCGAWSVPIMSMSPLTNLALSESRHAAVLMGGFTL